MSDDDELTRPWWAVWHDADGWHQAYQRTPFLPARDWVAATEVEERWEDGNTRCLGVDLKWLHGRGPRSVIQCRSRGTCELAHDYYVKEDEG